MMGIVFIGDIKAFQFFSFIALYIVGFFLVLAGLESLISGKGIKGKGVGVLGIIIGIIFAIIGTFAANQLVLAALIGAFLIIAGIIELIAPEIISQANIGTVLSSKDRDKSKECIDLNCVEYLNLVSIFMLFLKT